MPAPFVVSSTADSGPDTLSQAILDSNATPGSNTISFDITDSSDTINLLSALPAITVPVTLDGTTEPGYSGTPLIELNGSSAGSDASGLVIAAGNTTVEGLIINQFGADGIIVSGNNDVIAGNYIGTDATGTEALGNGNNGIWVMGGAQANQIGVNPRDADASAEPNLISANGNSGVLISDPGTMLNTVAGNRIGTDITGTLALPNGTNGITIDNGAMDNAVGGPAPGNTIAFNTQDGVAVSDPTTTGNTIRGDLIFGNGQLGIDLNGDGVTANHIGDSIAGPNNLQNDPVLTAATPGAATLVSGFLNSLPDLTYTIDFYAASRPDPSYYGAAQVYLGSTAVHTDALGNGTFSATLDVATTAGQWVCATATSTTGDTSEFSEAEPLPWQGLGVNPASWVPIGPGPVANNPVFSGRIEDAVADPSNPDVMYVAADGGGVWKTTDWNDPSPVWTPLTDSQPSDETGSGNIAYQMLAISASSPNLVYAAVGGPGGGILKSVDSGASWVELAGAQFNQVDFGTLLVSPTDPSTLYVTVWFDGSTAAGLYKSTDGGSTWVNMTSSFHDGAVSDVVMDPTDPSVLYAGMVQGADGGTTNGIYKSTDAGNTWTLMTSGTLSGSAVGVSIRLAISPSSPQTLYATVFDPALGNAPDGLPHRYVTTDGAASWSACAPLPTAEESRYWHVVLAVDPSNPNIVYTNGDHSVYVSTDSGATWTGTGFDDPVSVSFDDSGAYVLTGDRGVYRSTTGMAPFAYKQGNLQTAELYTLTLDPTNPDVAYGISQDQLAAMKFTGGLAWSYLTSGDEVGKILVDPAQPNLIYNFDPNAGGSSSANFVQRSSDGGATWVGAAAGIDTSVAGYGYAYASEKAFVIDPNNPDRLLLGTTHVYETTDEASTWTDISPDGFAGNPYIVALGIAPSQGNTVYVATSDGHIYMTQDDGGSWTESDAGLPVDYSDQIGSIAVDPQDPDHVFIATTTFPNDLYGSQHVWVTTDGGMSWTDITGNLPSGDWTTALAVDWRPATPVLYVGTARGVFSSTNLGTEWTVFQQGLPDATVTDLQFLPQDNLLAAATYGRGVFEIHTTPAATTVTSSATGSSTYGQGLTFTATVTPADSFTSTPTGTVQFQVDGSDLGPAVALASGVATLSGISTIGAGNHTITAVYSGDAAYSADAQSMTQVVTPAPLTVTADAKTTVFGAALPPLTATLSGFVNGDTSSVVSGMAGLSTTASASAASEVGSYPITVTAGTLAAMNYDFPTLINGVLTVNPATPTITWANPADITFGTPLGPAQLDATASVPGKFTYTPAAGTTLPAGPGQILSVSFTPTDSTDFTSATGSTTINVLVLTPPQVATITAVSSRKGLTSFAVSYNEPLNSSSAGSSALYHVFAAVTKIVKKHRETLFTRALALLGVSPSSSGNTVTINLARPYKGEVQVGVQGTITAANGASKSVNFLMNFK
jgi:hypothetical protein